MKQIQLEDIKQLSFWEVIVPFSGQLGVGSSLPDYFEQGNCDILPSKTGILIQKDVFLDLLDCSTLFQDFDVFYFFNIPGVNKNHYQIKYPIQEIEVMQRVGVSYICVKNGYD